MSLTPLPNEVNMKQLALASLLLAFANGRLHVRDDHDVGDLVDESEKKKLQYTPEPSDWSGIYAKTSNVPSVFEHTPAGIEWLGDDSWESWDGEVIDPTQYKDAEA